jgi:hypothetical protein
MKRIILLIILLTTFNRIFSQESTKKDYQGIVTYFCAGGPGYAFTINAEHTVLSKQSFWLSGRIGFGAHPIPINSGEFTFIGIPFGVNLFLRKTSFHPELGLSLSYVQGFERELMSFYHDEKNIYSKSILFVPTFGYRFQKKSGGLFGRIAFAPTYKIKELSKWKDFQNSNKTINGFEISVGYFFKS